MIIALLGMPGCGKTEAAKFLEKEGFTRIRFGDITEIELKKRGMDINEKNERLIREQLRKEHGMEAYAKLNLPRIKEHNDDVVLDGVRSYAEYALLKKEFKDIIFVSILVDKDIRYSRINVRKERSLSTDEIQERDAAELRNLDMAMPICLADKFIINNGTVEELKASMKKHLLF